MIFSTFAGIFAGLVHVVSGPDHFAAVAPLATDTTRPQWRAGLSWGLGHTTGVILIGALLIGFRAIIPLDLISAYGERLVGVALVALGVWAAVRARDLHLHIERPHAHPARPQNTTAGRGTSAGRASFAMGTLHGLAGSSHLFGVLPALALPSQPAALAYLAGFGFGAVAAMTAFAAIVGMLAARAGRKGTHAYRAMLYACSFSAFVVGGFWLVG